jgi:hypothetical protein
MSNGETGTRELSLLEDHAFTVPQGNVVVLMAMHVAIAVILYCAMVFVAPVRRISA